MQEKFDKLGEYKITLIQRPDGHKHWRLRISKTNKEWYFTEEYEYVIEQPTIEECLDRAIRYIETGEV